jgi:hypothetical protein
MNDFLNKKHHAIMKTCGLKQSQNHPGDIS